jgi:hypothetical protein
MLFIAASVLLASGCVSGDDEASSAAVPTENLPEGFELLGIINESTPGVDMETEIEDFQGEEDIGDVKATVGIYQWGELGKDYNAKVTILECQSPEYAQAAYNNYVNQTKFQKPPHKGVDRFSTAIVNGQEVTEIRDRARGDEIKYIYIWTDEKLVVLVEGNDDRAASLELASATKL